MQVDLRYFFESEDKTVREQAKDYFISLGMETEIWDDRVSAEK